MTQPTEILAMRHCDKCSDGATPECEDPECPFRDGLAALEGEDSTLIDPNFDREKVLAMVARAHALEESDGLPGQEAATRLDQSRLDVTKLYDDEDEDLPGFVERLIEESAAEDVIATDAHTNLRAETATQPGPREETTVEHDGPSTLSDEPSFPRMVDDPDAVTGRMDAVSLDALEISSDDDPATTSDPESPTMSLDEHEQSGDAEDDEDSTHVFAGGDPADLMAGVGDEEGATVELAQMDIAALRGAAQKEDPEESGSTVDLKPKMTLADLRASLKNRNTDDDTAEGIESLEEQTEDEPGGMTVEQDARPDEAEYERDETAQMEADEVDGLMNVPDARTSQDGTLQLDDGDILDFADDLIGDEVRTVELSVNAARRAAQQAGVSTKEATRPVPIQQDTTQQDQPGPDTIEAVMGGSKHPPQTYTQPPFQQPDPYGSGMAQYPPPQNGPAGSGMFMGPPQGGPGYPQQGPPQPGPYGPPPPQQSELIPYEAQFLQPKRSGRRWETFLIVAIVIVSLIGVVLAVLNFFR